MGGYGRIRVQTVRLIKNKINFINFIKPLYYFDAMVTGAKLYNLPIDKKGCDAINHLFDYKLAKEPNKKMDAYICETFDGYCENKKDIFINFDCLKYAKDFMRDLLLHSFE